MFVGSFLDFFCPQKTKDGMRSLMEISKISFIDVSVQRIPHNLLPKKTGAIKITGSRNELPPPKLFRFLFLSTLLLEKAINHNHLTRPKPTRIEFAAHPFRSI